MALRRLHDLIADTRATVALETAILLPAILLLMVGSWETYAYLRAASIVDRTAFTIADTLARKSLLYDRTAADDGDALGAYYEAALEIAQPVDLADGGSLIVSAVHDDGDRTTITWQRRAPFSDRSASSEIGTQGATPVLLTGEGRPVTLRTGETVIVAEVFLPFRPFLWSRAVWSDAPLTVTLYHRAVFMARYGGIDTLHP